MALGAGYTVATACDENVTVKAETALHAATGQLYVATIALSDLNQNATTGCGQKIMEAALKINGQMIYTSWSIPAASTNNTFTFGGANDLASEYYASTVLNPFQADGLTDIAITQLGSWNKRFISYGQEMGCAVLSSGGLKCWGRNSYGQVGDGTTTDRSTPVSVSGLSSGVTGISVGIANYSTCALLSTGAARCWGYNNYGQLGDGTKTNRSTSVAVSGLSSGVSAISTGDRFTCAVLSSGAAKCWGGNGSGQLGDGTITNSSTPVDVSGLSSGVTAISTGWSSSCALLSTGAVKCWGGNGSGQLGDGTITSSSTPVNVSTLSSGVRAISAGYGNTCALLGGGVVKCWGSNYAGQLGDGTTTQRLTPTTVVGLP
jgi:alpha-tubulin suppressor-like RCC1 family protein